jgi:membrane protease YdiL (CAAX protease family)
MTSPSEPRTPSLYHASRGSAFDPLVAAVIVSTAMASYLLVALTIPPGIALLVAQLTLAAVPVGAALVLGRPRALGLRGAHPRYFLAAIAIGATAWLVNMQLVAWLHVPEDGARTLEEIVERPSLSTALAMFALLPAVCEEIVFRGVLARALGKSLPIWAAAAASAIVFSAYHLSLVQALPTATLGFALAIVAIRADSIAPVIVAHALNNAIAITLSRGDASGLAAWIGRHPLESFVTCLAVTVGGVVLALRGAPA